MLKKRFNYVARNKNGKLEKDVIAATDRKDALRQIKSDRGLTPVVLNERGNVFTLSQWFKKRPSERLTFFRSYATLANAGSGPKKTYAILIEQIAKADQKSFRNKLNSFNRKVVQKSKFLHVIEGLAREVVGGMPLTEAMANRPNDFSEVESAMSEIGEATGQLPRILEQLAEFLERDRKFKKQLGDALTYPAIVLTFSILMIILLIVKIIPEFAKLFDGFKVELPITMKIMLGISTTLSNPLYLLAIFASIVGFIYLFGRSINTPTGALAFDKFRLKIPILGQLISRITVSRICRVLSMLTESGKGPEQALEVAIPVCESPMYAKSLSEAKGLIEKGKANTLYEALSQIDIFDPLVIGFAQVGDETGKVPEMLGRISDFYESDIESLTTQLPTVIQTLVTIMMGGIVFLIVFSVYVPLTQLINQIH